MGRFQLLFFVFSILAFQSFAQEKTIQFSVTGEKKEPVPFATVSVISVADTTHHQKKVSDSTGLVVFQLQQGLVYLVQISSVNYKPFEKTISIKGNDNFSFKLQALSSSMGNVVITATRPIMRQEDDKTIVDPEPIAAASTNAYEILEKTPGLFVDQDGNIYLSSMSPAAIYINGRQMKMSSADIATMLKNLPPTAIQRLEILRTPSAKYDASGSGGIINIVLKKGVKLGLTGSVSAGIQQGTYGNQFAGLNLNNNTGTKNFYVNLNYNRRNNFERIETNRFFAVDSVLQQNAFTKYPAETFFVSYGISDSLNEKWYVDFAGSVVYNRFDNTTENQNWIKKISTGEIISNSLNNVNFGGNYFRVNNGISFNRKIDSISEWSNDFYFSLDRNRIAQDYTIFTITPFYFSSNGYGSPDNDRNYFTFTSDLRKKFKHRLTLETGVKSTLLNYKSDAIYFRSSNAGMVKDNGRTNRFYYQENINSFYLQGSKTFGKNVILKTGARVENTNMNGNQIVPSDTSFDVHRTDLFPYVFLSKKVMSIAGYELRAYLVYRRTIVRPVYEQLNPFPKYVDQYLTEVGNPTLRPQFTTNYEFNISVDERPLLAVGINNTTDIFNQVVYQSDTSNRQSFRTYDNLGKNKEWYLRGLGAIPPGKKYFFVVGAQYNHNFYEGVYEGKPLSFKRGTWTLFTYHSLKLDKRSQMTLNGFVRFKGQQQFYELSTFGALNSSINRQFFQQKLTVTLSANDIFRTNRNEFSIAQGSIDATGTRQGDTQRFGVNLRYNFGIKKKEENTNNFIIDPPVNGN